MTREAPPDNSTTGRHIPALDGVRGLAILLVLADHLLWSNPNVGSSRAMHLFLSLHAAGWIGVDLFFVLSGFLITGILYDTLPAAHFFRNFYARRALRIFPLYYAFLLLLIALSTMQGYHWDAGVMRFLTYTENIFPGPVPTNAWWVNINHFWTLAIEEQFYLAWPLLVFLLRKRRNIAAVAMLGAVASLGTRIYLWQTGVATTSPYQLYSWTPARLDALLTGAALAMAVRSSRRELLFRYWRPVAAVAFVALAMFYLRYPGLHVPVYPVVEVWVPAILSALFAALLVGALVPGPSQRWFTGKTVRFFGRYSYGLYVFHPTIASFTLVQVRAFALHLGLGKGAGVLLSATATLSLSIAAALLSFHLFEKPVLRLKHRFHDTSRRPKLHEVVEQPGFETASPATGMSGLEHPVR